MVAEEVLVARFEKTHKPKGYRVHPLNIQKISEMDDCEILHDDGPAASGIRVKTSEGSLTIGINEGWIFEDSDGEHYPISDEALEGMYEVSDVIESAPF